MQMQWRCEHTRQPSVLHWSAAQVIDAEMARRKLLEESPIASTQEEPVLFDTSEIPWWAWVRRFHLPEVNHQLLSYLSIAPDLVDRLWKLWLVCFCVSADYVSAVHACSL